MRTSLVLFFVLGCAESRPGLYVRDASSRWFSKESQIEGVIKTSRGNGLFVQVIVTGDGDRAHLDVAASDDWYIVRDLPAGKYTVHYLLPGGERHVDVDLAPSQTRRIDVVVDEASVGKDWQGAFADSQHPSRTAPIAPPSCAPIQHLVGKWKGQSTEQSTQQHGPHTLAFQFDADGSYRGIFGGPFALPYLKKPLWAETRHVGSWCADSRMLMTLLTVHPDLRIPESVFGYAFDGDVLVVEALEIGQIRLQPLP